MKIKDSHIDETGFELSYPQELASKHDMTGVESLKVIIKGPFSEPEPGQFLPDSVYDLFVLSLKDLVLHYTGEPNRAPTYAEVQRLFTQVYDAVEDLKSRIQHITISWNRQTEKQHTWLSGNTFELKDADKRAIWQSIVRATGRGMTASRPYTKVAVRRAADRETKTLWPSIKVAVSENMEVGFMQVTLRSTNSVALKGLRDLMEWFLQTGRASTVGFEHLKTYQIGTMYVVNEDE